MCMNNVHRTWDFLEIKDRWGSIHTELWRNYDIGKAVVSKIFLIPGADKFSGTSSRSLNHNYTLFFVFQLSFSSNLFLYIKLMHIPQIFRFKIMVDYKKKKKWWPQILCRYRPGSMTYSTSEMLANITEEETSENVRWKCVCPPLLLLEPCCHVKKPRLVCWMMSNM